MKEKGLIRVADNGIEKFSVVNGPGLRYVIYVQGCSHNCEGCHNPQTHNFNDGKLMSIEEIVEDIYKIKDQIKGITLSGGDPLNVNNILGSENLCKSIKEIMPDKDIWLYTGYKWESIKDEEIVKYLDVIVDGRFVKELKSYELRFKGSSNQRIIDVKKSIEKDEIIEWKEI